MNSCRYSCILSCMHSAFTPEWTDHALLSKLNMKSWRHSCIHAGMHSSFTPAKTQHELLQTLLHTLVYALLIHSCMNSLNNPYSWVQSCMRSSWTPVKAQHELMLTLLYTLMCAVIVHSCRNSAELQLTLFHILMYELITHSFMNSLNNHHSCIQYCMHSSWTLVEAQYELIYKLLHTTMYAFIVHACRNLSWRHVETPVYTRVRTHLHSCMNSLKNHQSWDNLVCTYHELMYKFNINSYRYTCIHSCRHSLFISVDTQHELL